MVLFPAPHAPPGCAEEVPAVDKVVRAPHAE
jgi:hypothetical protein